MRFAIMGAGGVEKYFVSSANINLRAVSRCMAIKTDQIGPVRDQAAN